MKKHQKKNQLIYSESQYKKDDASFSKSLENNHSFDWSAFKRLMVHDLCINANAHETLSCGNFSIDDIKHAMDYPKSHSRVLVETSDYLMRISPHYNRLNTYYSNMAVFSWGLDVYDIRANVNVEQLRKQYFSLSAKLEKMSLKYEFSKIMKSLIYQDIFYGLCYENSSDFFIHPLDFRICSLHQVQDGIYNFKMNLSRIEPIYIHTYPDYVQQAYLSFTKGESTKWYIPPVEKQVCFKFNHDLYYPYPHLLSLIKDIFDLDIYKKLKLQSARTDNFKAILVTVPLDETTIDKPLVTPDTLAVFSEMNRESLSEDIGMLHTLGKNAQAISFKNSTGVANNVSDATNNIYDSSGVSKELFNGSSSGTALNYSIENDSGTIYSNVYRQLERWANRFIKLKKYNKATFKFAFYLMDVTIYNRDKVIDRYLKASSYGLPVKDKYLAALDMTPSRIEGALFLEKNIFKWCDRFTPLTSSHTQSSEKESGRPTNESSGKMLDKAGEQTSKDDSNAKR